MTAVGQTEADREVGQIVVIPVSLFRVHYQVAEGRPYSRLEQRVLQEIGEHGHSASLSSLRRTFHVHERLLVEAVVTLASAGWVAVVSGPEATFALTSEGQRACTSGKDPVTVTVGRPAPRIIVLDRTTGQLTRRGEARTITPEDARPRYFAQTPVRITSNTLDDSQVQKLLPRGTGEWVRSIGPTVLATHRRYLPVRAKVEEMVVYGLPQGWYHALAPLVLEAAERWIEDRDPVIIDLGSLPVAVEAVDTDEAAGSAQVVPDGIDVSAVASLVAVSESAITTASVSVSAEVAAAAVTVEQGDTTQVRVAVAATSGDDVSVIAVTAGTSTAGPPSPTMLTRRTAPLAAVVTATEVRRPTPDLSWVARTPSPPVEPPDRTEYVVVTEVLVNPAAHGLRLNDALRVADRQLFVASSLLTSAGLATVLANVEAAVGRGVRVDLTYGALGGGLTAREVVDTLNRIGYTAAGGRGRDLLRCGRQPTGSGADIVLHDRSGDRLEAVIGDHPWLGADGSPDEAREHPRSVSITGDAFLGSVAQAAGALMTAAGNRSAAERWHHLAEVCRDQAAIAATRGDEQNGEQVRAELIVDDEHVAVGSPSDRLLLVGGEMRRQEYHLRGVSVLFRDADAATVQEAFDKLSA